MRQLLERVRIAPTWVFALLLLAVGLTNAIINLWLAPRGFFDAPSRATGGLLHPTLLAGWIAIAIDVVLVLVVIGGVRPREVGLIAARVPAAFYATLGLWLATQVILAMLALIGGEGVHVDPGWTSGEAGLLVGGILGQLGGNALVEEVVFRGFMAVQLILRFQRAQPSTPRSSTLLAVILAGVLFALPHVPNRILKGEYTDGLAVFRDQAQLVLFGMYFAWIYLRTQNLFVAVGIHALANAPTAAIDLADVAFEPGLLVVLLGVVVTMFWPRRLPGEPFDRRSG